MRKESPCNGVKDVCAELEKAVQHRKGKTMGEWLRKRKERLQMDEKKIKREG